MKKDKLYLAYGSSAHEMTIDLLTAAKIAEEIPAGARIGLKPNLVVSDTAENGATTHPGVVTGAIEYLQAHGFRDITIMESAWIGDSTQRAFSVCGFHRIAEKYGVELCDLKKDAHRSVSTPAGNLNICARPLDCDYLITMPVLKGHCQTRMTCALKNSKGCIPDSEKRRFHTMGLHRPIAALATALKPDLVIVDSICGDLNFEEGGTPVQTNRMLLGRDPVKVDAYGCRLMGIDPTDVEYIALAEKWGVGTTQLDDEDVICINDPKDAPAYPSPSGLVSRLTRCVKQESACSACYGNLVHALYQLQDSYGRRVEIPVYIGQGHSGKDLNGIGIGRCCKGADIHVPGCPPNAADILRVLLENT